MQPLALALVVVLSACGASSAQLKVARSAQYTAPAAVVLDLAKSAAEDKYVVEAGGPLSFATRWQWYAREGGRQSAGAGGVAQISEGSVTLQLVVEVVEVDQARVAVTVTPHVLQKVTGSPKPRDLKPDDPEMPPWVHGRVDELSVAIYERAKQYVAKP